MNKLNRKLTVILLIILIVTVGINSLVLYQNTTRLINNTSRIETKNKADELADYLSSKIREGALPDEVKTVIDMMDIQVSILTLNKRVIYSNFTDLRIRKFLQDDYVITSQAEIYNKNQVVVAHVLVAQKNSEIERLNDIFKAALVSSITLGILIVLIFLVVIQLLVNKPLKKIMNALERDEELLLGKHSDWKAIGDIHNSARKKRMQQRIIQNQFFQNASHELKSPLMNIQGYMEGLEDQLYAQTEASHMVVNETQRIKTLIDQMIRSSKAEIIEAEDLEPEEIDMKGFIRDLSILIPKNIQVDYQASGDIFYFNRTALQIIMDNIIQNACRYAKTKITINYQDDGLNKEKKITISDDGDGIDPQILDSLFDRFVKGIKGNTGLGLSIAKQYVEATGGKINAYNHKGAVFEIVW